MTCSVCFHDDEAKSDSNVPVMPFIEIYGLERGPKFYECQWDGYSHSTVAKGKPITAYACPVCGTIKMEV